MSLRRSWVALVALALIGLLAARGAQAFQPQVGPLGASVIMSPNSSLVHTGQAGLYSLSRTETSTSIRYTVDRPAPLADVVFTRTRTRSTLTIEAGFVGDHGLLFNVIDADSATVNSSAVLLDLSAISPLQRTLYSQQVSAASAPTPRFLRNVDGSCLFTTLFLADIGGLDTLNLSAWRTDTNALLCSMPARNRAAGDTFLADILDTGDPVGSDTVRIRHHTQSSGNFDVLCQLPDLPRTERVSVANGGTQANLFGAFEEAISADGRFVAFSSSATNLVLNDTNNLEDIFVRDRLTNATTRVSVASGGTQATGGNSSNPTISADGRFVTFLSSATNLVANDTNGLTDVFVHDRGLASTTRVSVGSGGTQATGFSYGGDISADGRFVVFNTSSSNLVPNDTNNKSDVFVRDRSTGTTTRVSVGPGGVQANGSSGNGHLSADGRYVAFVSGATNLVPDDTNAEDDIFVYDRMSGTTTRVLAQGGVQTTGGQTVVYSISADGRFLGLESDATNLVANDTNNLTDSFLHDRLTGTNTRVSVGPNGAQSVGGDSFAAGVSADGRFVAFESRATNLVANDTNGLTDVFVRDVTTGSTTRASVSTTGAQGSFGGAGWSISGDGRYVAFGSSSPELVSNDTNGLSDIFVRDRGELPTGTFTLAPADIVVGTRERVNYAFTWTVPDPLNWHDLQSLHLVLTDGEDTVLWARWDEADNTVRLLNEATGEFEGGASPGSSRVLQTSQAKLHLVDTGLITHGPTNPSVTLNLSLSFKPRTEGRTLQVWVAAVNDEGVESGILEAGTVIVSP